jgi:RHS repeat-associated protein
MYHRRSLRRAWTGALLVPIYVHTLLTSCAGPPEPTTDVVEQAEGGVPGHTIPSFPPGSVVKAEAPIKLDGGGSVTDTGGAAYTLPLWIPDGPRGMQPDLSLVYGGNGNGHLGVGWGLTEMSTVAPCPRTIASDGLTDGIDFDGTDAFCLDGQRLVVPGQAYAPPASASGDVVYHTEVESFRRVIAHHDAATYGPLPSGFTVHDRDGITHEYVPVIGHRLTNDHAHSIIAVGTTRTPAYYVRVRTQDRDGNKIVYGYESTDAVGAGELANRLKTIEYGYSGSTPSRRIVFNYTAGRTDPIISYVAGIKTVIRSRLTSIDVYAPNPTTVAKVWRYDLRYVYSADTKRSLLAWIDLYDQFGVQSWTRELAYSGASGGFTEHTVPEVEFDGKALSYWSGFWERYQNSALYRWVAPTDVRIMLYDFDDDGDDDVLYRTRMSQIQAWNDHWQGTPVVDTGYQTWKGDLAVRRSSDAVGPNFRYDVDTHLEPGLNYAGEMDFSMAELGKTRIADLDADGHPELQLASVRVEHTGTWQDDPFTDWSNLDSFTFGYLSYPLNLTGAFADHIDVPVLTGAVVRASPQLGGYAMPRVPPFQRVIADLDGDGRVEPIDVAVPAGGLDSLSDTAVSWGSASFDHHPNGFPYETTLSSDGFATPFTGANWTCNNGQMIAADVDGDGRQDALAADREVVEPTLGYRGVYRKLSIDDPFNNVPPHGSATWEPVSKLWGGDCGEHQPDLVMGDWNGDGLVDALYPPGSYSEWNGSAWVYGANAQPYVRWNLGTGFGPVEPFGVAGVPWITALMRQDAPTDKDGLPVSWDKGTRTADVNGDGRTDILAFRQDNTECVDPVKNLGGIPEPVAFGCENKLVAFISAGDHFEGKELWTWQDAGASLAHGFSISQIGDVTGDGAIDAVHVNKGKLTTLELPWRTTPDQLTTVRDGSAYYALETFERTRAWWGHKARPEALLDAPVGPPCAWPITCPRGGFEVVRTHQVFVGTRPDGSAMHSTDVHVYADPRASLIGRGALGFGSHRIWNRETGSQTTRIFDHQTLDPFGTTALGPTTALPISGSVFYPYAGLPTLEYTVTPRQDRPTATELASTSVGPGLANNVPIPVRVVATERTFELRTNATHRQLTVLPAMTRITELDNQAQPDLSTQTPQYVAIDIHNAADRRIAETTWTFDALGNPNEVTTVIKSSVTGAAAMTHRQTAQYANCPSAACPDVWELGMATRVAAADYDADDVTSGVAPTRVVRTDYDAKGRPISMRANATDAFYWVCATGNPNPESCEAKSVEATFTYDSLGNPVTATATAVGDPNPRTTTLVWDTHGVYPAQRIDPLGIAVTTLIHPALGVPVLEVDENGVIATQVHDGFGRPTTATQSGAATVVSTYTTVSNGNRRGIRVDTTSADGAASYSTSDELGREIESGELGLGGQWSYSSVELDPFGSVVRASRPAFALGAPAATTDFDRLGRPTRDIGSDSSLTTYSNAMFESSTIDPSGHHTYLRTDLEGRLIESGHYVGAVTRGMQTFQYGPFDVEARTTDAAGNAIVTSYDGFGRVTRVNHPDSGVRVMTYDGFGQVVTETAGTDTVTRTYDKLGRLVTSVEPGGTQTRTYDTGTGAKHRLVSATSADGVTTTHTYDTLGRTRTTAQTIGAATHTIVHRYDDFSRLRHVFYPTVSGYNRFAISMAYSPQGTLQEVRDVSSCNYDPNYVTLPLCINTAPLWTALARDARFQVTSAKLGNGQIVGRTYDANTGLQRQLAVGGITTNFLYAPDGQLIERSEPSSGRLETFTYDDFHRLTSWTLQGPKDRDGNQPPAVGTSYEYTDLGDLMRVKRGSTVTFEATLGVPNKPHAIASSTVGGTYTYDARGRQITGGGRTTSYNHFDLPTQMTAGGVTRTYRYDAFGTRAQRSEPTTTVTYLDGLYEHRDTPTGTRDTFLVHAEPGLVAQVDYQGGTTTKRYVAGDSLGSTTLVYEGAALDERHYFDPFGGRIDAAGAAAVDSDPATSHGFTGHEEDGAGLINMNGRIYDRAQYRFLTPDPIVGDPVFGQSYNPYSYVTNNPTNLIDPSGYQAEPTTREETKTYYYRDDRNRSSWTRTIDAAQAQRRGPQSCPPDAPCARIKIHAMPGTATDDQGASASQHAPAEAPGLSEHAVGNDGASGGYQGGHDGASNGGFVSGHETPEPPLGEVILFALPMVIGVSAPVSAALFLGSMAIGMRDHESDDNWVIMMGPGGRTPTAAAGRAPVRATTRAPRVVNVAAAARAARLARIDKAYSGQGVKAGAKRALTGAAKKVRAPRVNKKLPTGWSSKANKNSYASTATQMLYVILDPRGRVWKYGTTWNFPKRYPGGVEANFGPGFTREFLNKGANARTIRDAERRLIDRYVYFNGSRPPGNMCDH